MKDIICPLCGKPNPPELDECQYCQAPLKTGGFLAPEEGEETPIPSSSDTAGEQKEKTVGADLTSSLEQAVPDWLNKTEASFMEPVEPPLEKSGSFPLSQQSDSLINPPLPAPGDQQSGIDDAWLESLLAEAGAGETRSAETSTPPHEESAGQTLKPTTYEHTSEVQEGKEEKGGKPVFPTPPAQKPEWLANLEKSSKIKLVGGISAGEQIQPAITEPPKAKSPIPTELPDWLGKAIGMKSAKRSKKPEEPKKSEESKKPEKPRKPKRSKESEKSKQTETAKEAEKRKAEQAPIAPAELPVWLEVIRPPEASLPTKPVEDVSGAEIVTSGPLMGLRGVLSAQPSALRAQKPPTYSIKLRVTEEQQARVRMMEELLAEEEKPKPLPPKPIITSRHIFRLIVAVVLLLPILWMIVTNSRKAPMPQPSNIPGVADFTQRIQALPANAPVLLAFDYEAGFSGEMNIAVSTLISQLILNNNYLALVATTPSGPPLAESIIKSTNAALSGEGAPYPNYADLGYIPGGTMGLLALVTSPSNTLPYAMDESDVWSKAPLDTIKAIKDFSAVIVITNDPDTARIWIEQVGPQLQEAYTPLLFISSSQAEPLIRPYYEAYPSQVQGLIAGLAGGVAYASAVGNGQQNGTWDAFSIGVTISALIILIGSIVGVIMNMISSGNNKEPQGQ